MKNAFPAKIKRSKPTFIRIKANKKEMKYNNDNVRRQDRLLEEDRAYALLRNLEKTTIDLVVLSKRIIMLTHEFEETYLIKKQREEE